MKYEQLLLFPPTVEEILIHRVNELESKLDRQRKSQFGKIGEIKKQCDELFSRLKIIEEGICKTSRTKEELYEIYQVQAI